MVSMDYLFPVPNGNIFHIVSAKAGNIWKQARQNWQTINSLNIREKQGKSLTLAVSSTVLIDSFSLDTMNYEFAFPL